MAERTCSIPGCSADATVPGTARGWCRAHYKRWMRRGDPLSPTPPRHRNDMLVRWRAKVDERGPDECWEWTASRDKLGYGFFRVESNKPMRKAHRIGWELLNGRPLGPDEHVCHHCDNPPCCNPAHWFIGTHADNMADRSAKGRASRMGGPRGDASPLSKLTDEQVREIRSIYAAGGVSQAELGRRFGVGQRHISRIVRGTRRKA